MRQLKDLVQCRENVWIYLSTDEVARCFIQQAMEEGFRWRNGDPITEDTSGRLFGVHQDMTIAHIAMFAWCMTFSNLKDKKDASGFIDYERYISGESDYICHEPHLKGGMYLK